MKILFFTLIFFLSFKTQAQNSTFDSLFAYIENWTLKDDIENDQHWSLRKSENEIVVQFTGRFTYNSLLGPSKYVAKKTKKIPFDTLTIAFFFEPNWTENRIENQQEINKKSIENLSKTYIVYYDSLGWPFRHSQTVFEDDPVYFLTKFPQLDSLEFNEIKRIPDFLFQSIGVFYDFSYDPQFEAISQRSINEEIEEFIQYCVKLDGRIQIGLDKKPNY